MSPVWDPDISTLAEEPSKKTFIDFVDKYNIALLQGFLMMNYEDASRLLLSIRGIRDRTDRLRAATIVFPLDAVQSACKLSEPSVEITDRAVVYRFSENGLASYECLPDVQYCSCQYFEKNVVFHGSSATVQTI